MNPKKNVAEVKVKSLKSNQKAVQSYEVVCVYKISLLYKHLTLHVWHKANKAIPKMTTMM